MREIKFRAWDGNRMWFSGQEGEEDERGNTYQLYYDREASTYKASLLGPQFLVTNDPYPMYHPGDEVRCRLMQNTGLKDTNDIEIYEEDIISTHKHDFVVKWDGIGGMYLFHEINNPDSGMDYYEFEENYSYYGFHVVGNTFENPELLEDK